MKTKAEENEFTAACREAIEQHLPEDSSQEEKDEYVKEWAGSMLDEFKRNLDEFNARCDWERANSHIRYNH